MSQVIINPYAYVLTAPPAVTYVGSPTELTTDLTTYTFTSAAIGAVISGLETNRRIVVAVHWGESANARTLSSATIGGIAATIHIQPAAITRGCVLISALVPTGTTANIALTFSGAMQHCYIAVYRAVNETSSSPVATATDSTFSGAVEDVSLNVTAGGWVIAAQSTNGLAPRSVTWAGVTTPGNYDAVDTEAGGVYYSGSHQSALGTGAPRSVTTTTSNATSITGSAVALSWV